MERGVMADFELPSKVSSSKCGSFASTRASFDDASPMSVSCASDASTASPRCGDEPLKVALPSYNPMDLNDRFVFDIDASRRLNPLADCKWYAQCGANLRRSFRL